MGNQKQISAIGVQEKKEKKEKGNKNQLVSSPAGEADDGWWERQSVWSRAESDWSRKSSERPQTARLINKLASVTMWTTKTTTKKQMFVAEAHFIGSHQPERRGEKLESCSEQKNAWEIKKYQVVAKSTKTARVNAMKGQSRRGRQKEAGLSLSLSFFLITNYKFTAFLFVPTHGHNYLWLELAVKPGRVLAR